MKTQLILALSLAASAPAFASDDVNIKRVKLTGYECPADKATFINTSTDDADTFNQVVVEFTNTSAFLANRDPEYKGTTSRTCFLEMDIEVPAGYTIGSLNTHYDFLYDMGSSFPKLGIYTNLYSEGLNLWSTKKRSSRTIYGKRYAPTVIAKEGQIEANFTDIGGLNHPDCHKDRTVRVKIESRLFVTHRRSSTAWGTGIGMDKMTYTLPVNNGLVGVPCGGSSSGGWNWGWWGW